MFLDHFLTASKGCHILYSILIVLLCIQLYYFLLVYSRLAFYKVKSYKDDSKLPSLSIIICAYNEQENLKKFLPLILNQDYPQFEVIVIDDNSSDETKWVLQEFKINYPTLHIIEIKEFIRLKHTKKFALTLGVKAAKYEHLIMTDADCQPSSNLWLKEMAGAYLQQNTEIVLGYSPYFREKGLLNKLIRYETTHTAMSYLSFALKRNAYMGVGRNLSYLKSLFINNKGFKSHMHIKSGDDDLFVNENATSTNVNIAIHPDAHMYSIPKKTWKSYYKQKARHAGASVLYKKRHQWSLAIQLISSLLFYGTLVLNLLLYPNYWYIGLIIFLLRFFVQLLVYAPIFKKLGVKDLLIWLPFLDVFFYFYICINGLFNRKKKIQTWS